MTTGERIKMKRIEKGISADELAASIGVSRSTIFRYENGNIEKFPVDRLEPIAQTLNTTVAFLMGWEDDLYISKAFHIIPVGKQGHRPILGSISAGLGTYAEESVIGWEAVDEKYDTDEYFFLRVEGDSMSPKIDDGDLLLIKKQDSVDSGDIAAFLVDDEEGFIKKVKYDTDYITLISLNPAYEPMVFLGEDVLRVRVVGKAVEIIRKL